MTRTVKHRPEDNKFLSRPKLSVMHAFETAVLLMEQSGCTEEDIMKYVHLVHMGWIREGAFSPEYIELVRQVEQEKQRERMEAEATEARLKALRASVDSTVITNHRH
jgi:hypothetical protein